MLHYVTVSPAPSPLATECRSVLHCTGVQIKQCVYTAEEEVEARKRSCDGLAFKGLWENTSLLLGMHLIILSIWHGATKSSAVLRNTSPGLIR